MKKILLFLLFATSISAFAQKGVYDPKIVFSIKAGATFPTYTVSGADAKGETPSSIASYYAGIAANIPLIGILSIQPGLSLVNKGASLSVGSSSVTTQFAPLYIETPINFMVNMATGRGGLFFVGAGPYWDFVVGGTLSITGKPDKNLDYGADFNNDIRSGDFGFNFLMGYQLKNGFNIHAGYGLGLINVQADPSLDKEYKNRVVSVGLGFSF